jgi:phosphoribosylanthranilate isomerase
VRIKICGITNVEDALICQQLGADALGFVFYKKSPRYISTQTAREIINRLSPLVTTVGVFVDESAREINHIAWEAKLHAVQLHGDEPPAMIMQIDRPVIKAFRVGTDFDFNTLDRYSGCGFLLDSYSENKYGGFGQPFDWNIIPTDLRDKIILAGGVSVDNIAEIMQKIQPAAVDVSSALEVYKGKKDPTAVQQFFHKIEMLRRKNADSDGIGDTTL